MMTMLLAYFCLRSVNLLDRLHVDQVVLRDLLDSCFCAYELIMMGYLFHAQQKYNFM